LRQQQGQGLYLYAHISTGEKMTREDIVCMAEECGIPEFENNESQAENIMRFAALVASAEREACAEIAEKQRYAMHISLTSHPVQNGTAVGIANAIRARGQA
jgi:hypothetical protein